MRSSMFSRRVPRDIGLVVCAALLFAGCFHDPDIGKITCNQAKGCPTGYTCAVSGKCCKSADGITCDGADAAASEVQSRIDSSAADSASPVDGPAADSVQDTVAPTVDVARIDVASATGGTGGNGGNGGNGGSGGGSGANGAFDVSAGDVSSDIRGTGGTDGATPLDVATDKPIVIDAPTDGLIPDAPGTCSVDKDCPATAPLCLANRCAKCATDTDCVGRAGPACAVATGLCVACTANKYCTGVAATCDTTTNQCVGCVKRSDCPSACQACTSGVCTAVKNQDDPGVCAGTCDAAGACKAIKGQTCQSVAGGCLAGTTCSPDGICCDKACMGSCEACDVAGFVGTCTPVASGNPHGNRTSCGTDLTCAGTCQGNADGTCSYPTKNCGAGPSCSGTDKFVAQSTCASGSCQTQAPQPCQGGFACTGTACNATCQTSADCQADYFCYNQKCHSDVVSVALGAPTCVALKNGRAMCWGGGGTWGITLGDGTIRGTPVGTPVQVVNLTNVKVVRSAGITVCALTTLGTIFCWGDGVYGELGSGTTTTPNGTASLVATPVQVVTASGSPLTGMNALYAGNNSFCAIGTTGIYCWGANYGGSLGYPQPDSPEILLSASRLPGASGFASFAMGGTLQVATEGYTTVDVWGADYQGTIDPLKSGATYPNWGAQSFATTSNVSQVISGGDYACALYLAGQVQCWGTNYYGYLGNGTTTGSVIPGNKIAGFAATHLAGGNDFVCAQTADLSNVVCWGNNVNGVIGSDTSVNFLSPTKVSLNLPASQTVAEVIASAGSGTVCTIISDGSLMCWGDNSALQTGTGLTSALVTLPSFVQPNW
jgi:alpha-tubulin suppressor-like RCC1 family protein